MHRSKAAILFDSFDSFLQDMLKTVIKHHKVFRFHINLTYNMDFIKNNLHLIYLCCGQWLIWSHCTLTDNFMCSPYQLRCYTFSIFCQ